MKLEVTELKVKQIWQDVCSEALVGPGDVITYLDSLDDFRNSDREVFVVLHLDTRNRVIAHEITSIGSQSASLVHPREVFKAAILKGADGIVLAHNHPSGDPAPSKEDISLTHRLRDAGHLVGIDVMDHVIVAPPEGSISFKELGIL